jgi:hypothetical protein
LLMAGVVHTYLGMYVIAVSYGVRYVCM